MVGAATPCAPGEIHAVQAAYAERDEDPVRWLAPRGMTPVSGPRGDDAATRSLTDRRAQRPQRIGQKVP